MPYAPTRAVHETDCLEAMVRTMKASMKLWAERSEQGPDQKIRQAYRQTLDSMKSREWLRVGLNTDKKIIERNTLRHFDKSSAFLPMKARILEEHMQTQHVMIHEGMLCDAENEGTMTRVVLDTLRDHPAVLYGHNRIRALSEDCLTSILSEEMKLLQRQSRVVHQLMELHNRDYVLANQAKCLDLKRLAFAHRRSSQMSTER